jgi:hypothetical protein
MTTVTLRCPQCEYENLVLTCGFCIQCGADLSHLVPELPEITSPDSSSTAEIASDHSADNVSALVTAGATLLGVTPARSSAGWRLTLPTRNDRKQAIHVLVDDKDQAKCTLCFLSICGSASSDNAMALLEWNSRLTGCAFAVRTINDERMFVLTANLPVHMLDAALLAETAQRIAKRADQVENKLSLGADKY